ncbi:MAG: hypothetical protein NTZ90_15995 [Proteobacteria bacterium]|nr:hypothetical protein [Pseudomonadota bacterium]
MGLKLDHYETVKNVVKAAWALFVLAGCSVKPVTDHNTHAVKGAEATAQEQSVEATAQSPAGNAAQSKSPAPHDATLPSGHHGSFNLKVPAGLPAEVNQIRLSVAKRTKKLDVAEYQLQSAEGDVSVRQNDIDATGLNKSNVAPLRLPAGESFESGNAFTLKVQLDQLRQIALRLAAEFEAELLAEAKACPIGQKIFHFGAGVTQLDRIDLDPGQYVILVEVLNGASGKVYQKGRGEVEIEAGKVAQINIKLETVGDANGGLVVTLGASGYTIHGLPKTCPEQKPEIVCAANAILLSTSDKLWQQSCLDQGFKLVRCTVDACDFAVPSAETSLCTGVVTQNLPAVGAF